MELPETTASILELTADLGRVPSRARVDAYDPILDVVGNWLRSRNIACEILHRKVNPSEYTSSYRRASTAL